MEQHDCVKFPVGVDSNTIINKNYSLFIVIN